MKRYGIAIVALAALAFAGRAGAQELGRLALDDAGAIGTRIATDTTVAIEGLASVRVDTAWPTTVNLGEIDGLDVDGAKLLFTAQVRSAGLVGVAYLEMWAHFGKKAYFSRGLDATIAGTGDWRRLEVPFLLRPGQRPDRVTLNLVIKGNGTVWVDDARLLRRPLP